MKHISKFLIISIFLVLNLSANTRIISLSPSVTEIIFALNAGKNLVGTTSYSIYPKRAKKLPIVGGHTNLNLEKILSLYPTLVVGQKFSANILVKLQLFNIKTLQLNLDTIKNIQLSISKLSMELKREDFGKKLNTDIQNAIISFKTDKNPHTVMIVYGLREILKNSTYIAGKNIFFQEIIKICGNKNTYTADFGSQVVLSYEDIIALDPQQIIILRSATTEPNIDVEKALKNWHSLPIRASKNKKISIVDEDYIQIPSHRIALTITRLCEEMTDGYR